MERTVGLDYAAESRKMTVLPSPGSLSMAMLPANLVVMEIKVNERILYWLTGLVAAHNLPITG